jgi:hypothetical protein
MEMANAILKARGYSLPPERQCSNNPFRPEDLLQSRDELPPPQKVAREVHRVAREELEGTLKELLGCRRTISTAALFVSGFNKKLDEELGRFSRRQLESEYPYLILARGMRPSGDFPLSFVD